MTIDIHKAIGKLPIIPKRGFVLPNMNYCGAYNPLDKQLIYDKNGNILRYMQKPSGNTDAICAQHDVDYTLAKNLKDKHIADEKMIKAINKLPYNQQQYGTFLVKNIIRSKRKLGLGVENHNKILSEELHKSKRKNYTRRKIIVNHIDEIFAADLVEMQKFAKLNKGYRYLITCIDIFSKYSWVIPLKDKKGINVKNALQKIFKQRKSKFLWTDKGTEFYNKQVQDLLNENNIKLYSTNNSEIKSAVIERFNRTFKNMMYKKFTENNNTIFYNILDELVNNYNNKYHSTIKMTPIEGSKKINEKKIKNIYNFDKTKKPGKFKIGDRVRISLEKDIFEKSYETNWTEEIFVIYDIKYGNVPYYYLKDLNNEKLQGTFYEQELQKSKQNDLYTIEKILKTNKDKIFVKWRGYDNSFNSCINKSTVTKYL